MEFTGWQYYKLKIMSHIGVASSTTGFLSRLIIILD